MLRKNKLSIILSTALITTALFGFFEDKTNGSVRIITGKEDGVITENSFFKDSSLSNVDFSKPNSAKEIMIMKKYKDKNEELNKIKVDMEVKTKEVIDIQSQVKLLNTKLETVELQKNKSTQEIEVISKNLKDSKEKVDKLENERKTLQDKLENEKKNLQEKLDKTNKDNVKLSAIEKQLTDEKNISKELQSKNKILTGSVVDLQKELESLKQKGKDLDILKASIDKEKKELTDKNKNLEDNKKLLSSELDKLKVENEETISILKDEIIELNKNIKNYKEKFSSKDKLAKSKIDNYEMTMINLKKQLTDEKAKENEIVKTKENALKTKEETIKTKEETIVKLNKELELLKSKTQTQALKDKDNKSNIELKNNADGKITKNEIMEKMKALNEVNMNPTPKETMASINVNKKQEQTKLEPKVEPKPEQKVEVKVTHPSDITLYTNAMINIAKIKNIIVHINDANLNKGVLTQAVNEIENKINKPQSTMDFTKNKISYDIETLVDECEGLEVNIVLIQDKNLPKKSILEKVRKIKDSFKNMI